MFMKKFSIKCGFILITYLSVFGCKSMEDSYVLEHKTDGSTIRYHIVDGAKQGALIKWNKENHIILTEQWAKGRKNGDLIFYYNTGEVNIKSSYVNGLENGLYVEFYRNGDTIRVGNIKNGLIIGEFREYYKNNIIKNKVDYRIIGKRNFSNGYKEYNLAGAVTKCHKWPLYSFNKRNFSLGDTVSFSVELSCAREKHLKGYLVNDLDDTIRVDSKKFKHIRPNDNPFVKINVVATKRGRNHIYGNLSNYTDLKDSVDYEGTKYKIAREFRISFIKSYYVK